MRLPPLTTVFVLSEVVGGMEPKLKKTKKGGKDEKKLSWKSLTKKELNDLEKWLEENSMKENSRNLSLADIATHVASTYHIKARFSPIASLWIKNFFSARIAPRKSLL